jgi:plastocyanin
MLGDGFDPSAPEMLLWAKPDGELIPRADLGECVDGAWTGDDGYQIVGAAFLLALQDDHPETFAGPIDNWHIHFSACNGASSDAIQGDEQSCIEAGGVFFAKTPVWMMHAYVADGFDNQLGVFAMYNDSIWPLGQDLTLANQQTTPSESGVDASIVNFDFGSDLRVSAGETITFSNSDSLPHTVTAGSPGQASDAFDSGVLGAGDAFTQQFDEPGQYSLFCSLHPQMTATIVVE